MDIEIQVGTVIMLRISVGCLFDFMIIITIYIIMVNHITVFIYSDYRLCAIITIIININ